MLKVFLKNLILMKRNHYDWEDSANPIYAYGTSTETCTLPTNADRKSADFSDTFCDICCVSPSFGTIFIYFPLKKSNWKSCKSQQRLRGFESHALRQNSPNPLWIKEIRAFYIHFLTVKNNQKNQKTSTKKHKKNTPKKTGLSIRWKTLSTVLFYLLARV